MGEEVWNSSSSYGVMKQDSEGPAPIDQFMDKQALRSAEPDFSEVINKCGMLTCMFGYSLVRSVGTATSRGRCG